MPLIFVEKEDDAKYFFFNLKNKKYKIKNKRKKYIEMIHVHVPSLSSCVSILYLTVHLLCIYLPKEIRIIHK